MIRVSVDLTMINIKYYESDLIPTSIYKLTSRVSFWKYDTKPDTQRKCLLFSIEGFLFIHFSNFKFIHFSN